MTGGDRWGVPLALGALACLLAMFAVTLASSVSQETFEIVRAPDAYAAGLRAHATALRALFGMDSAFIVLYSALFLAFGRHIATARTRALIAVGIGAIL